MVAIPCSLTHVSPTTTTLHGSVSARASAPFFSGGASFDKSVPNRHKRKFARFTKVRVFVILLRELGKEVRDKSFDNLLEFGRPSCRRRPAITVNSPPTWRFPQGGGRRSRWRRRPSSRSKTCAFL